MSQERIKVQPRRGGPGLAAAWVLLPASVTVFQIAAKRVAASPTGIGPLRWLAAILTSSWFPLVVASEICGFVAWIYVLARMPLSEALPLSAVAFVAVLLSSWLLFHEPATLAQVVGSAAIIVGVFLVGSRSDD